MRFKFDWDPAKAKQNKRKHGIAFEEAMDVLRDPLALSVPDVAERDEERWVTLGRGGSDKLLVVVHTYVDVGEDRAHIRIISARRPTKRETRQYEEL